ncbi:MAG: hypothetical protein IKP55_06585, partial [Clostridia bacterium]|nr:hypothetical protein [Clostridia bacterium]
RLDAEEIDPNQLTIEDAEARAAFQTAEPNQPSAPEEPEPEGEEPEITDDGLPFTEDEIAQKNEPDDGIPEASVELILGPEN